MKNEITMSPKQLILSVTPTHKILMALHLLSFHFSAIFPGDQEGRRYQLYRPNQSHPDHVTFGASRERSYRDRVVRSVPRGFSCEGHPLRTVGSPGIAGGVSEEGAAVER